MFFVQPSACFLSFLFSFNFFSHPGNSDSRKVQMKNQFAVSRKRVVDASFVISCGVYNEVCTSGLPVHRTSEEIFFVDKYNVEKCLEHRRWVEEMH